MKRLSSPIILGFLLLCGQISARAAQTPPASSDWPSLDYDAAHSNANLVEKGITAKTFLKFKVKWPRPGMAPVLIPDVSYPIVSAGRVYLPIVENGRVHVRALDATTGKQIALYTKDALGGLVMTGGRLYLAGHVLQAVDPLTGEKLVQINAHPGLKGGTFVHPIADNKLIIAGYASTVSAATTNSLYAVDLQTNKILWKTPSLNALGAIGAGRILTQTSTGSIFYDEHDGKMLAHQNALYSDWFAGPTLNYTVASVRNGKDTLYAYDGTGKQIWKRVVGLRLTALNWPHAVGKKSVYVQTLTPSSGIVALDAETGKKLWSRQVPNIQQIVLANRLLLVLSYGLGQPIRLSALKVRTGAMVGAITLSSGYYAFGSPNDLMVASGLLFLRVSGPGGSQLLALGS